MADQLRYCNACETYRHVSAFNVGWRDCWDCESTRRKLVADLGMVTPDQAYAANERKIWEYAKARGLKVDRLID